MAGNTTSKFNTISEQTSREVGFFMRINPYRYLELPNGASIEECKASFRRLAKQYHPDVNKTPEASRKFIILKKCFDFLNDPERKAQFDQRIAKPQYTVITYTGSWSYSNVTVTVRYE